MKIDRQSSDSRKPYLHLLPIVNELVARGNAQLDDGFGMDQSGWSCQLRESIDFDLVRSRFELPDTIILGEAHDSIHDTLAWIVIEGPGAHQNRK